MVARLVRITDASAAALGLRYRDGHVRKGERRSGVRRSGFSRGDDLVRVRLLSPPVEVVIDSGEGATGNITCRRNYRHGIVVDGVRSGRHREQRGCSDRDNIDELGFHDTSWLS